MKRFLSILLLVGLTGACSLPQSKSRAVFLLLDYLVDFNVRLAFLDPWPAWRAVYYLFCFACVSVKQRLLQIGQRSINVFSSFCSRQRQIRPPIEWATR